MREYIEKKCPLGENRFLTQQAYLWSWAWETGFRHNNVELLSAASRGLLFIDQAAGDQGRTHLAWLLTGLPEPQFSITQRNRSRHSLTPFSRLASANWIGANVAFLKDLDFLQTKIHATGKTQKEGDKEQGDEGDRPKKGPWKKKKKKEEQEQS